MGRPRRILLAILLLATMTALCGCKQNPTEERLYARLFAYFEDRGYACALSDEGPGDPAPLYVSMAWKTLHLGEESVFVYFDESNRADYLAEGIDQDKFGYATHFGLRFVLAYPGTDEGVLNALRGMEGE